MLSANLPVFIATLSLTALCLVVVPCPSTREARVTGIWQLLLPAPSATGMAWAKCVRPQWSKLETKGREKGLQHVGVYCQTPRCHPDVDITNPHTHHRTLLLMDLGLFGVAGKGWCRNDAANNIMVKWKQLSHWRIVGSLTDETNFLLAFNKSIPTNLVNAGWCYACSTFSLRILAHHNCLSSRGCHNTAVRQLSNFYTHT